MQRVSECELVVFCGAAAPNVPLPIQKPFAKIWYRVKSRAPKGHGTWVYAPPSPRPSPALRRGERVEGVGDVIPTNGKRDILSAPAPQSGCAGGWYRLKRKSVLGNSIIGFPAVPLP